VGTADEFWTAFNAKKKAEISKPPEIAVAIEQTEDASDDDDEIPF
jgi:hypothetical protein